MDEMRLQKAIAESGLCSRRKAEDLIEEGRVKVNGRKASIGQKINPAKDIVLVDGERLRPPSRRRLYIMLHKPRGYLTAMSDERGRRCVSELVADAPERVYPVGRLDLNSEGLLLFTNDGEFANAMMHPAYQVPKCYRVTVRETVSDEQMLRLSEGVEIEGGMTNPAQVKIVAEESNRTVMLITITEGRNRQVRRMCEAVNLSVARLKRISVGPVKLGMLKPGAWRELSKDEVDMLLETAGRAARQKDKGEGKNASFKAVKRRG